jgi:hypothetical protein
MRSEVDDHDHTFPTKDPSLSILHNALSPRSTRQLAPKGGRFSRFIFHGIGRWPLGVNDPALKLSPKRFGEFVPPFPIWR